MSQRKLPLTSRHCTRGGDNDGQSERKVCNGDLQYIIVLMIDQGPCVLMSPSCHSLKFSTVQNVHLRYVLTNLFRLSRNHPVTQM